MTKKNVSVLIIEQDANYANTIKQLVGEIGLEIAAVVNDVATALSFITNESPDLILANTIFQETLLDTIQTPILFLANSSNTFEHRKGNKLGYMLKPVDKTTLKSCINHAIYNHKESTGNLAPTQSFVVKGALFFKKGGVYQKIILAEIYFFQSNGDYTIVETLKGRYTTSVRLNRLAALLENTTFSRVHRSYIINLAKITAVDVDNYILTLDNHQIPFSRRSKNSLLDRLSIM